MDFIWEILFIGAGAAAIYMTHKALWYKMRIWEGDRTPYRYESSHYLSDDESE